MPSKKKTLSVLNTGMNLDLHPSSFQEGMYAFGLNGVDEEFDGNFQLYQNEASNILTVSFPEGFKVVGFINVVEQNRVVWFIANNTTGKSEIGETQNFQVCRKFANDGYFSCDDCSSLKLLNKIPLEKITQVPCASYTTIQNDDCLNFNIKFPINSVAYRILPCSIEVFFTDNNNPRRYLEFNYINDDPTQALFIKQTFYQIVGFDNPPCDAPIYGPDLDCNALNVQPDMSMPCIEYGELTGGGSNRAGDYQFFIAMSDKDGNLRTGFLSATNPIPIFLPNHVGIDTNYLTDRSIPLTIKFLDTSGVFQYYVLAVAKTIDNVTSYFTIGTFPISQSFYTYTGNNAQNETATTIEALLAKYPYYETAKSVTSSNGILLWANTKLYPRPNLQRVANNIILYWQTIAIPEEVYTDPLVCAKFRSNMRDEVYPYGIQFIFDRGEESNAYHIPGRVATGEDLEVISNDDVIQAGHCTGNTQAARWQVYNTGSILGGDLSIYNGCEENCYQYGLMSYWESTRTYPNNPLIWGDLCGMPIRHHKFPDSTITHIHNREGLSVDASGGTFVQNNIVFPIGIKVDTDSVRSAIADAVTGGFITQADADSIVGYRIVRGNRFGNKSVIAKGMLYDVNQYVRLSDTGVPIDQQTVYFGNYPYNDVRANPFITNSDANYDEHDTPKGANLPFTFSNRYTFHSPDTKFAQPSIGTELKLETVEYGEAEAFYDVCQNQAKQKFASNTAYFIALTAGVVAALLRTNNDSNQKFSYTVKSDYANVHDGDDGTMGVTTGTLTDGSGTLSSSDEGFQLDDRRTKHNNPYGDSDPDAIANQIYGKSGAVGPQLEDINGDDVEPAEYTYTTLQGTYHQYFNGYMVTALNNIAFGLGDTVGVILTVIGQLESFIQIVLQEMNIVLDIINTFNQYRDWCIQYNSVGKYNTYVPVLNDAGNKRRLIGSSAYLQPGNNQTIFEPVNSGSGSFNSIKFNNFDREDSVYLRYIGDALEDAGTYSGIQDTSRTLFSQAPFTGRMNALAYTPISSYYGAIKNFVPDQYGSIFDIEYLRTDSCYFDLGAASSGCTAVYGGDTFIGRFAFKTKVPYFLSTTFDLPSGVAFDYSAVTNLAFPRFYYNNTNGLGSGFNSMTDILSAIDIFDPDSMFDKYGRPKSIRDASSSPIFYQNGFIYLYSYGIPYYFAESDYNVDFRFPTNDAEGDFYPHQQDLTFWLQEKNVPIAEPNIYNYNTTYSKQNKETSIAIDAPDFEPGRECRVELPTTIFYTIAQDWLVYRANDFFTYPLSDGEIISIEGIENQTVLVRTLNKTSVFKSILRTRVDGQTTQVGNGGLFDNPPQDFGTTTLGYVGTQNVAILHTEYGHVWADAKRGQVFNLESGAGGIDEISKYGFRNWFKENLPFRILRSFPNMPIDDADNAFLGIGLVMAFDKRYSRMLMTKLDYKLIDNTVLYDSDNKDFYIQSGSTRVPVTLGDKRYFKDCSWTLSYNFLRKQWRYAHSYKPNYYLNFVDFFGSGINNPSSFWMHQIFNGSFQVFYGKLYPFIAEPVLKYDYPLQRLDYIELDTEVRRYQNEFDYTLKKNDPGFNKLIVYNDLYSTGELNLVIKNPNDFSTTGKYPKKNVSSWDVEIATDNYKWRVNQLFGLNKDNSEIPMWMYMGNNLDKVLNRPAFNYNKKDLSLPYLKGQWFKTRFINDSESNYKIILRVTLNDETDIY